MPIGAFKLNGIAKYMAPVAIGADWTAYTGSQDGAVASTATAYTGYRVMGMLMLSSTYGVYMHNNFSARQAITHYPITVSDTTVTIGSSSTALSTPTTYNENQEFQMFRVNSTTWGFTRYGDFFPVTWNGTTGHTLGSKTSLTFTNGYVFRWVIKATDNQLVHLASTTTNTGVSIVTFSGGVFTKQTEYTLNGHAYAQIKQLTSTKFVIMYRDTADTYTKAKLMTISGNLASFSAAITVDTSILLGYYYDYRFNKQTDTESYTTTIFGGITGQQIKIWPITESAGSITLGTAVTLAVPDAANYQNLGDYQIYPIDSTHWMISTIYQNSTTAANRIIANKGIKVNSNGTISQSSWTTITSTTTGSNMANIYVSASRLDDNRLIFQWINNVSLNLKVVKKT
jgi:hypothetical protein